MVSIQDRLSRSVYHASGIVSAYQSWQRIPIDEAMALMKYQPAFVGRDVLDLGVGTGRTTRFLAPLAGSYQGIDFSPEMVEWVHEHLPSAPVQLGDIRDLSAFEDLSFDFVFASNNVISAVDHADRLHVLQEVHRVLRPGGKFLFSSHNREYAEAGAGPRLHLHRNPITALRDVLTFARQQINHARVKRYRSSAEEFELLDDVGHDFSLLHYYIDRTHSERQLVSEGFRVLEVFDPSGRSLASDDDHAHAPFLLYVTEKLGRAPRHSASSSQEPSAQTVPPPLTTRQPPQRPSKASPGPTIDV